MNIKAAQIVIVATLFLVYNTQVSATVIDINPGGGFTVFPAGTAVGAKVEGSSSDACLMFDQDLDPDGDGFATASDSCPGTNGTVSGAFAFAKAPGLLPAITTTFAATDAGVGESSDAGAAATAGGKIISSGAINGGFDIDIDPLIITEGNASGSMSFFLTFRNTLIFMAAALLDQGTLTISGEFLDSYFDVTVTGQRTVAELINTHFFVPFAIATDEIGKELPFEFRQVFSVHAENAGFAQVSVPEPSTSLLLISGWLALKLGFMGKRNSRRITMV